MERDTNTHTHTQRQRERETGGEERREYEGGILLFLNPNSRIHAGSRSTHEHTHTGACISLKLREAYIENTAQTDTHTSTYTEGKNTYMYAESGHTGTMKAVIF